MNLDLGSVFIGCLIGAAGVLLLTLVAAGFHVWRQGWNEGAQLSGEGIERARKRGEL